MSLAVGSNHLHVVQGGGDVSHQAHQEKWHLQDRGREEIEPIDKPVIPCDRVEVDKERRTP